MNYRNISTTKVTFLSNFNFQSAGGFGGGEKKYWFYSPSCFLPQVYLPYGENINSALAPFWGE